MKSIIFFFSLLFTFSIHAQDMTITQMGTILKKEAAELEGEKGIWQAMYYERLLLIVTDSSANRMRIFTPIIETKELEPGQKEKMLEANFHSALDAKYSVYQGYVMSVYTHPLKELTDPQFVDAMQQVVILANTFGTSYQSTDIIFGGGQETEEPKINQSPKKEKNN